MKLYVNFAFLENFFLAEEDSDDDIRYQVKKLLKSNRSGVDIILDKDIEELFNNPEKRAIIRQITSNYTSTDVNFIKKSQDISFHDNNETKIFFIDGVELDIEKQFGCLQVSNNTIHKSELIFHTESVRMDSNSKDWSFLKEIKHPCNSIVITDDYLFDNDYKLENIISIFDNLLPNTINNKFSFDITIIGCKRDNKDKKIQEIKYGYTARGFSSIYSSLANHLKTKYKYPINLTILSVSHHDRRIYTNYYKIISEKGFGLFNNGKIRKKDETSVQIIPLTSLGKLSTTEEVANKELKRCGDSFLTMLNSDKIYGAKKNRLLT